MQNLDTALAAGGRFLIATLFLLSGVGKIAAPAMIQAISLQQDCRPRCSFT